MVYFKRKVVEIPEAKEPEDENTLVWYIAATGEYFDKYSAYLARMDFYNQRKFICELTGHSCLTYFEAVESERRESEQVIRSFPDPLKEPILRRVQFSQVSRLDALVDDVYSSLKNEFFPGELAIAKVGEQRVRVIVREKARFNAIMAPDGTVAKPAYSRYRVQMVADDSQDMAVEESQLSRDRKLFTKLILRTFIKHAVSRDSWAGAPWVVKPEYAHRYRLDTSWPLHLRRPPAVGGSESPGQGRGKKGDGKSKIKTEDDGTGATHKFKLETGEKRKRGGSKKDGEDGAKKRVKGENDAEGGTKKRGRKDATNSDGTPSAEPTAASTTGRGKKAKWVENDLDVPREPGEKDATRAPWKRELEPDQQHLVGALLEAWVFMNMYSEPLLLEPFTFDAFLDALHMSEPAGESTLLDEVHCALLAQMVDEDGDLQVTLPIAAKPKRRRGDSDDEDEEEEGESDVDDADKDKNGDADIKDVNGKTENGSSKVKDKVRDKVRDEDEDEDEEQDQDNDQEEDQDQEDEEQNQTHDQNQESGSESESDNHQAEAFMSYQNSDWKERLRKKMFRDGGWQQILIGILHSVQDVPWWTEDAEAALRYLANKERPVTLASAAAGYYELPFELRVKIVSILVQLLHGAPEIRAYIERCAEETMRIRRDRLERQREIKTLADVIKALEVEIKAAKQSRLTDVAEPKEEDTDKEAQETETPTKKGRRGKKAADADKTPSKDKDEAAATPTKAGPGNLVKLEKKLAQSNAKMEELYEANRESELELVRLDCQRMRMLGSDRFCNRYWWFEHNGMRKHEYKTGNEDKHDDTSDDNDGGEGEGESFGDGKGERSTRTADADESTNEDDEEEHTTNYAMGRLWIQGPSEGDFRMFLDLPSDYAVSPTPLERKKLTEGQGFLQGPQDWAYYDEPVEIEELIAFLDPRGKREFKLLAELKTLRDEIIASLEERRKDTAASQAEREQELAAALEDAISDDENADGSADVDDTETGDEILPNRRRSGRASRIADDSDEPGPKRKADGRRRGRPARRAAVKTRSEATAEVLARPTPRVRWWTNELAVQELGHTLYDSYRKRGPRRRI